MSKGMPDFADRLNALFERVPDPATNKPCTNAAVALELSEAGTPVTAAYLGLLRAAKKQDPSARLVGALASFFGVPVDYFFDSGKAASITQQLEQLAALRDEGVRGIMTRAQGVSPQALNQVAGILEHIRTLEGLDAHAQTQEAADQ